MRISQNTGFLIDILRSAGEGKLVPAAFQRPYVWSQDDVVAFWTSLLRKWPTGSMLIWEPDASVDMSRVGRTRLGPIESDGNATGIILDGQNRLASFAWSLRLPEDPMPGIDALSLAERVTWANREILVLDPEVRAARFVDEDEIYGDRLLLPAGLVVDIPKFWKFVRKRLEQGVPDWHVNWFDECGNAIREARCSTVVLERASPADALEAFRHIAKAGVPMSEQDFEAAMAFAFDPAPKP
jgi:hypothetical protein